MTLAATDAENDPLTFSLQSGPAFATLVGAAITLTPDYARAGNYTLAVQVSDGTTSVDGSLAVIVTNTNRARVLTAVPTW